MTALQHSVTLHRGTVLQFSRRNLESAKMPKPPRKPRNSNRVRAVGHQVHPAVLFAAERIRDGGSYTRIEVISSTCVIVR